MLLFDSIDIFVLRQLATKGMSVPQTVFYRRLQLGSGATK